MQWFRAAVVCALVACLAGCSGREPFNAGSPSAVFPAGSCRAALGDLRDVAPPAHPGSGLLDRGSHPSNAVICEYGRAASLPASSPDGLAQQIDLGAASADRLASAVARIDVGTTAGAAGCPNDTGGATVIAFGYRTAPTIDLWWHSTGCQTIDNGAVQAVQVANPCFEDFQTAFADVTRTTR